uniref:Uncharacterized protein n=1 Tax=Moumouvirus sp. 'Monve' TaxID=1128131 RepID=H2EES2_9VIRU|nr:hypothetical protein mv_R690 [Moumouvirus Monve]
MKLIILLFLIVIIFIIILQLRKPKNNVNDNIDTNFYEKFKETKINSPDIYQNKKIYHTKKYIQPNISSNRIKISKLVEIINKKYMRDIIFNPANNAIIQTQDNYYDIFKNVSKKLKRDVDSWNSQLIKSLFKTKIEIIDMMPCLITQTSDEFIMEILVYAKIQYQNIYLKMVYYGSRNKNIDFFDNNTSNKYIIQFMKILLLTKETYQFFMENIEINKNPFMTMDEQMEYVNKINELHREEME